MKYLILVGDGMGDRPLADKGGRTLLELAPTPNMDRLAQQGTVGLARTIPPGFEPGSDTANMSLMGYDPAVYHTGRSPIEAASLGVELAPDEISFRCNLVSLDRSGGRTIMADYCAGHIDSENAAELIKLLDQELGTKDLRFYPGVSFRHLLVWRNGPLKAATVPPHDRSGQAVDDVLSHEGELAAITALTEKSWPLLADHPINRARRGQGQNPADSIWLWGQGTKPSLPSFQERFGLSGLTVSAVDLIKGLGVLSGLDPVEVEGATGWLDTNYQGKVEATLAGLGEKDIAFLHVEAPDEAGHSGVFDTKFKAIEQFDRLVVGPVLEGLADLGPHRVLLATDHYTPVEVKTHTTEPVPYVIYDSQKPGPGAAAYNEAQVSQACGGKEIAGYSLVERLLEA